MKRASFTALSLVFLLGCKSSESGKKDAAVDAPSGTGGSGGAAGRGGAGGTGGSGGAGGAGGSVGGAGGARTDAAVDAALMPDGPPPDVWRTEALAPSDAALPASNPFVYLGAGDEIRIYQLNMMTGELVPRSTVPASVVQAEIPSQPMSATTISGYMVWDSKKSFMYSIHRAPPSAVADGGAVRRVAAVTAFKIDKMTGGLTKHGKTALIDVDGPTHLSIHPNDKFLFLAHFNGHGTSVLAINGDGTLGSVVDSRFPPAMVPATWPLRNAHMAYLDKSGKYMFVPALMSNVVNQFTVDAMTGKLTENTPPTVMVPSMPPPGVPDGGAAANPGPRHMAIHPDEKFAYLVNESQGTITVFNYDAMKGTLGAVVENISAVPPGMTEGATAHVLVHPMNKTWLYVSNRNTRSLSVFKIDLMTGRLTLVENEKGNMDVFFPRNFSIDPTGKWLLVANERNYPESVANVFEISAMDGALTAKPSVGIQNGTQFVGILNP